MSQLESFRVLLVDDDASKLESMEAVLAEHAVLPCRVLVTAHAGELLDYVPDEDRKMLGMLRKPFSPEQLVERVNQFAGVAHLKRSNAALKSVVPGDRE